MQSFDLALAQYVALLELRTTGEAGHGSGDVKTVSQPLETTVGPTSTLKP